MRTDCRRDQLAPHRDAQARAAPACALIAPRHKGRKAWSVLILLNTARVYTEIKRARPGKIGLSDLRGLGAAARRLISVWGAQLKGGLSISIPGAGGKG
jgi:hypothetical protein